MKARKSMKAMKSKVEKDQRSESKRKTLIWTIAPLL